MVQTTYSDARANFARYLDKAADDRETIVIRRRGKPDVALIAAEELESMRETLYLLRSPENARRLLEAWEESERGGGVRMTVDELRRELGLDREA